MKPATISGKDVRFLTSPSTGIKIPVIAARGNVFSAWVPSPEDLDALKKGEPLWLVQRGDYIPEMHMVVGRRDTVVPVEFSLEAQKMLSPEVQHAARVEAAVQKYGTAVGYAVFVLAAALIGGLAYFVTAKAQSLPAKVSTPRPVMMYAHPNP